MKTPQKVTAKLVLHKETIKTLTDDQLTKAGGGLTWTDPRVCTTRYTCATTKCTV